MSGDLEVLSLGAGVQSTTLALLAVEGVLPKPDVAIFADTGWEPDAVYDHLERLTATMTAAGIPVVVVSEGNLRSDALDLDKPIGLPVFVKNPDGSTGKKVRACTDRYKLRPIREHIRGLLGARPSPITACTACRGSGERVAPWRAKRDDHVAGVCSVCDGDGILERVGLPPRGKWARVWIGFSTDEIERVTDRGPGYARPWHPLLDLNMSRVQCEAWLAIRGWETTPKSACIGCPFHGNKMWRDMRDNDPKSWNDAVSFDAEYRHDPGLRGQQYLHRSLLPLSVAPIDRVQPREHREAQSNLFDQLAIEEMGDPQGCSPYGCHSGSAA